MRVGSGLPVLFDHSHPGADDQRGRVPVEEDAGGLCEEIRAWEEEPKASVVEVDRTFTVEMARVEPGSVYPVVSK